MTAPGLDGGALVDAIVVNWNGRRFLPGCLAALDASSIRARVTVVDNASNDGSAEHVRTSFPHVEVLPLSRNVGYAGGANAGLRATRAPFAMVLNPDVVLAQDHLEILVRRMQADPAIGAAQGKLFATTPEDFVSGRLGTGTLDSAGHSIRRTRMVFDRGQGEPDDGRWDREVSVFSATGAALMMRRTMLDDVAPDGAPFDPDFFAYKEDIDLCWRARLRGWDVRYIPGAVGWHVRAVPGPGGKGPAGSARARRHSWMNHWLMIVKNDTAADAIRHFPWILGWEVARAGHALLRDRALLPSYARIWARLPAALRARRATHARRRAKPGAIRPWFNEDAIEEGRLT